MSAGLDRDAGPGETCHACCLVLDEDGILIRGEAGSGKSSLCLALIDDADRSARHAALVGDDTIRLSRRHGRLVARGHPATNALIEIRGHGIVRLPTIEAAVIRLVVDLVAELPRLPAAESTTTTILDVAVPLLRLEPRQARQYLIRRAVAAVRHRPTGSEPGPADSVSSQTHSPLLGALRP